MAMTPAGADNWRDARNLVALDLEGSGPQDRDQEAILEIAAVRLINGRPDVANAYTTLVNPIRRITARPWTSPGLTAEALTRAPRLTTVTPQLAARLNGAYLIGHNIGVDWRLLHRHCPTIRVAGLIDTYRLARTIPTTGSRSLTALLDAHQLTDRVNAAAPTSAPHRALWDTIGGALLLDALIRRRWTHDPSLGELIAVAGFNPGADHHDATEPASLLDQLHCGLHGER